MTELRVRIAESSADGLSNSFHGPGKCMSAEEHVRITKGLMAMAEETALKHAERIENMQYDHAMYKAQE